MKIKLETKVFILPTCFSASLETFKADMITLQVYNMLGKFNRNFTSFRHTKQVGVWHRVYKITTFNPTILPFSSSSDCFTFQYSFVIPNRLRESIGSINKTLFYVYYACE